MLLKQIKAGQLSCSEPVSTPPRWLGCRGNPRGESEAISADSKSSHSSLRNAGEAFLPAVGQISLFSHFHKRLGLLMTTADGVALPLSAVFTIEQTQALDLFFHRLVSFQHDFDFQLLVGEKREKATERGHKYCENEMTEHLREGLRRFGSTSRAAAFWPTRLSTMVIKKKGISRANELKPDKFNRNEAEKESGRM